jgi:hypothetical protein
VSDGSLTFMLVERLFGKIEKSSTDVSWCQYFLSKLSMLIVLKDFFIDSSSFQLQKVVPWEFWQ